MLADPCDSVLTPGLFADSSGILSRYKTSVYPAEATTNGYLLWNPNALSESNAGSAFYWSAASAATQPSNLVATPFGAGPIANTSIQQSLGANPFAISAICADYRTISACLRLMYNGTTSGCTGRIAFVENITPEQLLSAGGGAPLSVNNLFDLSTKTSRTQLDAMEIRYRPNVTASDIYRRKLYDTSINVGVVASTISTVSTSSRFGDVFYGFAWMGVASNQLVFETIHNIEWRPEAGQGYASTVPKLIHPSPVMGSLLKYLDDQYPGWTHKAWDYMQRGITQFSQQVLSGSPAMREAARSGRQMIMP